MNCRNSATASTRRTPWWRLSALLGAALVVSNMLNAQVLFNETFTGNVSTAGFTTEMISGVNGWSFSNPAARNITGGFSGGFAILDSDWWCEEVDAGGRLVSPAFDASVAGGYVLDFDQQFRYCCTNQPTVQVWDGTTWNTVLTLPQSSQGYPNPSTHTNLDITAAAGGFSAAKIRFSYTATCAWWWAVDNIVVTRLPACTDTPTAGTITGTSTPVCGSGTSRTLTYTNPNTGVAGITWVWQSSVAPFDTWTNLGTTATQATGAVTQTTQFRVVTTCSTSGLTATSAPFTYTVNPNPVVGVTPTSTTLCASTPQVLTATGASTYAWSPSTGLSATTGDMVTATAATTTTYTVTGTLNGCTATAQSTIAVIPAPIITATTATPATICAGSNSQLQVTASPVGYVLGSGGASFIDISTTGTAITGLSDDSEHNITIPSFTFNNVAYTTARLGMNGAVVFGSTSGDVNAANAALPVSTFGTAGTPGLALWWDDLDIFESSYIRTQQVGDVFVIQYMAAHDANQGGTVTFQAQLHLLTGNIYFVYPDVTFGAGTNNAGASATVGINFSATSALQYSFNTASLTDGQVISFTPNTITGYAWSPGTFLSSTSVANPTATAVTETTAYSVVVTNGNGCTSTGNVTVTVGAGAPPEATISAGGPTTFCAGGSVLLTSSVTGGCAPLSYSWSDGTNVVSTDLNYTASTNGSYTLTVTDNASQTAASNTIAVVVNTPSTVSVTPTTGLICGTGSVELTASGAVSYTWSPASGLSATTGDVVTASPTVTTTYTATGTDANNCTNTASATITYSVVPTVTAASSLPTVCAGSAVDLTSTISTVQNLLSENFNGTAEGWTKTNTTSGGSPATADWTLRASPFTLNGQTISSNDASQFYNSNADLAGNGSLTQTTLVSPAFSTVGMSSASLNFFHYFRYVQTGDTCAVEITTDGTTWTNVQKYFGASVGTAGTWASAALDLNAFVGYSNVQLRFRFRSPWGYSWSIDNVVVVGSRVSGPFAWTSDPAGFTSAVQNPTGVVVNATTTYTVNATNGAGCSNTAQVTVTVGTPAPPTVSITAGGPTTFCAGGSVLLSSSASGGCPALTYSWSDGTNVVGTDPTLSVTTNGSYTLTVTDANLTSASSNTIAVTVVANPTISVTPSTPVICGSGSVEMTASGADTYTWSPATGLSATTGATVTATLSASQTYTVTGTNTTTTCVGSTTVSVQVSPIPTVSITPASVDQCDGTALLTANASIQSLEVVLSSINANSAAILATVPTPSGFTDGVTGTSIGDGCSDMYDTGNILGTNLGGTLAYSDNVVISSAAMGTNGRYFTRKIGSAACGSSPSMFFWAGDINGLTSLNISGNLGADGSGTQQLSTFTVSANGITYTALLKRVFGAGDPSVNQIFLIPQPNTAAQAMGTTTDNNQHDITSLGGVTRFYYVLYAGASGALINDVQAQAIAQSIVNAIPNGTISYSWSTDETTPAITVSTSGTYTVTAEANGCEGTASVVVNIAEPSEAGTDGTLTVCNVDAPVALFGSLGGTPDAGGSWTGPDAMAHSGTLDPATDAAGTYTYTVTGASPCPNVSATVEVTIGAATVWYADTDGDGYGDPNAPTADCGQPDGYVANNLDNCPADGGKRDPGVCGCGTPDTDSDGDGIADCIDSCPAVPGQIGSTCNDGDPNTIGDVLNASCTCAGTVAPPCAGNSVALVLNTDANGSQTSWEIIPQAGGAALCSGNSYASNSSITATCCLADGCYQLRVLDSFGDGMTTGGYTLVNSSNQRIIDNLNNGAGFTTVSQISGGLGFCLPIGSDHMVASSCDQMNLLSTSVLQAEPNPFVSAQWLVGNQTNDGYQFWIYDPNGSYSRRAFVSHATVNTGGPYGATRASYLNLASLITSPVPQFKVLNVRVRTMVNGVYGEYGPACRIKIDPAVECQTTQLTTVGNPSVSCGATQVPLPGGVLHANLVNGANIYQWEFSAPGYLRKITSPTRSLTLTNWVTMPLSCGTTYNVRVRASFNGGASYCAFGPSCTITTQACARPDGATSRMDEVSDGSEFSIWPNPNRGDLLNVRVDRFDVPVEQVMVDVMDMFGKRVMARAIAVDNGPLNTVLELDADLASGVYLVHVTAGEQTFVKRLVVQK